jgi:CRISPR type III-A-associated RAMP protein Csm4
MPTYNIIKLKNLTPLHIGTGREEYDFSATDLHSDTLSAAIAALYIRQEESSDLKSFMESFTLSSAFPFYQNSYFLPSMKGKVNISVENKREYEYHKQLKRLKYIEIENWSKLIQGENLKVEGIQLQDGFLFKKGEGTENMSCKPFEAQVNQRVTVPRQEGEDAMPFYFEWTYFQPNAGLYCLTDAKDELFKQLVKLFHLLGEMGIGSDRSVGGGQFEIEESRLTLPDVDNADSTMLLSLYIPTEEEVPLLNLPESQYDITLRGGYIAGSSEEKFKHLRKKSIYMFTVGSVFAATDKLYGKVVDLSPEWNDKRMHPVYRSGKPFILPIKRAKNE